MDNTITKNDFTGRLNLSVGEYSLNKFNSFINEYQENLLIRFLGVDLYRELETYYDAGSLPAVGKWDNFLNGVDYNSTLTGHTQKYKGFNDLLKKVIWSEWTVSPEYSNETGTFAAENENSKHVTNRKLLKITNKIYNEAVSDSYFMLNYLTVFEVDFKDVTIFFQTLKLKGDNLRTLH